MLTRAPEQDVGGAPTASRFLVDYTSVEGLATPADPQYPIQVAGRAVLDDGTGIGGVRHQFRDVDGGMEALFTVEFPATVPGRFLRERQRHLTVELGNWIAAGAD